MVCGEMGRHMEQLGMSVSNMETRNCRRESEIVPESVRIETWPQQDLDIFLSPHLELLLV